MPGGTLAQPSFDGDELEIVPCWSPRRRTSGPRRPSAMPAGMASDHAHSQLPRLPRPVVGRQRVADLVGDGRVLRVGHEGGGDGGVDPHAALALLEQRQVLVEAVGRGARRAGVLHQVDVELQRVLPFRLVELRLPVLVEPARAEGVRHGGQEGHVLAPAGLAAQADAVDAVGAVGHLARPPRAMNSQVGASGMVSPAFSIRSLRYMMKELSP